MNLCPYLGRQVSTLASSYTRVFTPSIGTDFKNLSNPVLMWFNVISWSFVSWKYRCAVAYLMSGTANCVQTKRHVHITTLESIFCSIFTNNLIRQSVILWKENDQDHQDHTSTKTIWCQGSPFCVIWHSRFITILTVFRSSSSPRAFTHRQSLSTASSWHFPCVFVNFGTV